MPSITIYTTPVSGYVTIRERYAEGAIVAEGTAPVTAYKTGQWVYYVTFGDVEGYQRPDDGGGLLTSDKVRTYIYAPISPPPNGDNGVPPNGELPPEEPAAIPFIVVASIATLIAIAAFLGLRG